MIIGIVLAAAIQQLTGYFTETTRKPVRDIGKTSLTGPATVILAGISVGLESAVYSALLIGAAVAGAAHCSAAARSSCRCSRSRSPAPACSRRSA